MKGWIQAEVERVVGRVAIHDGIRTGKRYLTLRIPHLEEAGGVGKAAEMKVIGSGPLRLKRRSWRREQPLPPRYRLRHVQLGVERIYRRVFKDWGHGKVREETEIVGDPQSFVAGRLHQGAVSSRIFAGRIGCLREGRQGLGVVMLLAINTGFGEQILVSGIAFVRFVDRRNLRLARAVSPTAR